VTKNSPFSEYRNFYRWADDYVAKTTKFLFGRPLVDYSGGIKDKIMAKCGHLFISCTQADAGFKAVVDEKIIQIPMPNKLKYLSDILIRDRIYEFSNGDDIILGDTAVKLQNKIHQICSGTIITQSIMNETETKSNVLDLFKAEYIRDNYRGKRIAVFTLFKAEKEAMNTVFANITDDPYIFEHDPTKIFVGQFQSHSEGVKLLAADVIIMYNIMFSSVKYQQSIERSQDYTRGHNSEVHWLFTDGGIEEKIYNRVINKQDYTNSYFKEDYL